MMSKYALLLLMLLFSACSSLHDNNGWEHNKQGNPTTVLEHKH